MAAAAGADRVHDRVRNLVRGRDVRCHGLRDVVAACLQPRCAVVQLPARAGVLRPRLRWTRGMLPPSAPQWSTRCRERRTIEDVEIDGPGIGEVFVRVVASGVCHSDVHALQRPRDGLPRAVRPRPRARRDRRGGRPRCAPPPARRPRRRVPVGVLRALRELRDREVVPVLHRRLRPRTRRAGAICTTPTAPFTSSWRWAASPSTCS